VNLYFHWTVEFEKWRSLLLQTSDRTSDIPPNQGSIPFIFPLHVKYLLIYWEKSGIHFILLACGLKISICYNGHVPAFKGVHWLQHEKFWRLIGPVRIVVQHGISNKFLFFCCKTLLCLFFVVNQSSFISSSTFCSKTKHSDLSVLFCCGTQNFELIFVVCSTFNFCNIEDFTDMKDSNDNNELAEFYQHRILQILMYNSLLQTSFFYH
jgi:hypothetical protein